MGRRSVRVDMLAWYPPRWRERYGDELSALMEDTLGGKRPTLRFRLSMAWAGLRERGHEAGVIGDTEPDSSRTRTGSLLVLCAWAALVVAGGSFAKLAEGFRRDSLGPMRSLPVGAYDTVAVAAIVGAVLILCAAGIALPTFVRFLRAGGWASIRAHVVRALISTAVAAAALAALAAVAHTLTAAQRNGELLYHPVVWYYLVQFIVTMLLLAAMVALWTVAAVATVRQLDLPRPVLSAASVLAAAVAGAMVVTAAAAAVWWGAIASAEPWFLQGRRIGTAGSAFPPQLVGTMAVMLLACLTATFGVSRIVRARAQLRLEGTPGPS